MHLNDDDLVYDIEREKAQWGWNWLERWMATRPYHVHNSGTQENSYRTVAATEDVSEKTVEMDVVSASGSDQASLGLYVKDFDSAQQQQLRAGNVPSYMAPTQSAKAKVRYNGPVGPVKQRSPKGPQWNSSTKKGSFGSGCDSSSSGGGATVYQTLRSPSPKNIAPMQTRRGSGGYSPDFSGASDWALPTQGQGWKHDFA